MIEASPPSCLRVRARLALMLDGTLAPLEAALDRGHLEACAGCARERVRHAQLLATIRAACQPHARDVQLVTSAVLASLPARRPVRAAQRWIANAALAGAAAAVLLALRWSTAGPGATPHALDLVTLDRFLEQLPSWSDVVRGLGSLSRHIS